MNVYGFVTRYDWYQTDSSVTVIIYTRHTALRPPDVIIELTSPTIESSSSSKSFHVRVLVSSHTFHVQRGQYAIIESELTGSLR